MGAMIENISASTAVGEEYSPEARARAQRRRTPTSTGAAEDSPFSVRIVEVEGQLSEINHGYASMRVRLRELERRGVSLLGAAGEERVRINALLASNREQYAAAQRRLSELRELQRRELQLRSERGAPPFSSASGSGSTAEGDLQAARERNDIRNQEILDRRRGPAAAAGGGLFKSMFKRKKSKRSRKKSKRRRRKSRTRRRSR